MKSWKYIIVGYCLLLVMGLSSSQATWLSKDDFMYQYGGKFVQDFPATVSRRAVVSKWCNALLDTTLLTTGSKTKEQISGWVYADAGVYVSPQQSLMAYLLCHPYVDGKQFDKTMTTTFKTIKYEDIDVQRRKLCPVTTKANNLNTCDFDQLATDLFVVLTNDLTNVRMGTSWGYVSVDPKQSIEAMTQYFAQGEESKNESYVESINRMLCPSKDIYYLGDGEMEHCGFPQTNAYISSQATTKGKTILNKSTILNGIKLLDVSCSFATGYTTLVGCGINNHRSSQAFGDMLHNEQWVYEQFMAMYRRMSEINATVLLGDRTEIGQYEQTALLGQLTNRIYSQTSRIQDTMNISSTIISQFESYYGIHLGMRLVEERSASAVKNFVSRWQDNLQYYFAGRNNTQVPSSTAKGA